MRPYWIMAMTVDDVATTSISSSDHECLQAAHGAFSARTWKRSIPLRGPNNSRWSTYIRTQCGLQSALDTVHKYVLPILQCRPPSELCIHKRASRAQYGLTAALSPHMLLESGVVNTITSDSLSVRQLSSYPISFARVRVRVPREYQP